MLLSEVCGPAFVYIGFSLIQIFIDVYAGAFNSAFLKFVVMIIFTLVINILCSLGYTVIAWVLVFIPIIMMTLISTLLLRIFGLDPDKKDLRKNVNSARDVSLNLFDITDAELLNQQQYSYLYDKFRNENRVDRDKLRKELYDKVDLNFDLSRNTYDLSRNPTKYFIVNSIVNRLAEQSFVKDVVNSRIYNAVFSNWLMGNNDLYNNYIASGYQGIVAPNNAFLGLPMTPFGYGSTITSTGGQTITASGETYAQRYSNANRLNGFLLFKENKYNSVRRQLYGTSTNIDNVKIDQEIERLWKKLSAAEQATWNRTPATGGVTSISYDYYNLSSLDQARTRNAAQQILTGVRGAQNNEVCPANETPARFKARTGLECYELCPPGKERDSAGQCVRACQSGTIRDQATGTCIARS
jgi:hypothetical protein